MRLLVLFALVAGAAAQVAVAGEQLLEVFVATGCPHCAAAEDYLERLRKVRPGLRVIVRDVAREPAAAAELQRLARGAGVWPPGVPTFVRDGRVLVGFDDDPSWQRHLLAFLDDGAVTTGAVDTRWFGNLTVARLGLPLFTLALGLIDGFNPCAMWVLLFLLSLLVRLRDRRRMALIAGTFVAVSGIVYYAFMAAWLNVFLVLGLSAAVRWTVALFALVIGTVNVKDFFAFGRGVTFSIPARAKPGIYARVRAIIAAPTLGLSLALVIALAILVNFVELLCTAGLPALYTAVLSQHEPSVASRYAYLALYILGYLTDDALMVTLAVLALGQRRLSERAGRWLKFLSGAVMIALGFVLGLRPQWLN